MFDRLFNGVPSLSSIVVVVARRRPAIHERLGFSEKYHTIFHGCIVAPASNRT